MTDVRSAGLTVLAVDDEPPALDELHYLLRTDERVGRVYTAGDATSALRLLQDIAVDSAFLDIRMPGLDGMELAKVLARFAHPPTVVFVTAADDRAADAFDLGVADYVRKPIRAVRIAESLRRVAAVRAAAESATAEPGGEAADDPTIPVDLAGVTRLLPRSAVHWVEAQGDYARLHTADGSYLVRVPLAVLAERWHNAGFLRVHRGFLVRLDLVTEVRLTGSEHTITIDGHQLPVARRHVRELKDRLIRTARQQWG